MRGDFNKKPDTTPVPGERGIALAMPQTNMLWRRMGKLASFCVLTELAAADDPYVDDIVSAAVTRVGVVDQLIDSARNTQQERLKGEPT